MLSIIWIWSAFLGVACAQNQFTDPHGGVNNEWSQTWSVGDTMRISWKEDWEGAGDSPDQVDLWITWFTNDAFSQLIKAVEVYREKDITMGKSGSLDWKVNITNAVAKAENRFVLRLKPHSSPPVYTPNTNQASGVGFKILPNSNPDTTFSQTSSSTSTASSTTATSLTESSPPATTSPPVGNNNNNNSNSSSGKKKTNVGAIAGGVLGGLVFIILLLVIALLALRLKKRKQKEASGLAAGEGLMAHTGDREDVKYYHDAPSGAGGAAAPVELADMHGTRVMHEIGTESEWRRP
ncbi:hypothetical protein K505DRAFT_414574 [Melanomma pulvis-pyrius CBS 109.77]|uniref:Mid2 domain-containing protein n=1 Tax=Melanomma pulvis-pyrius CBS 109.77 TaxID=1314802 RepID=A0A6A6XP80_9PLEO|nr:hypothetical protein K505DRAFT_414574 [Melanomma pulvis-pyrius CBS 109.77]